MSIFNLFHSKNYLDNLNEAIKKPAKDGGLAEPEHQAAPRSLANQRSYSRYNSEFSARILHKKQSLSVIIINYSETSIGILVDKSIALNDSIELELLPKGGRPITLQADVKRCFEVGNKYMVGAQITIIGGKYASIFRHLELHSSGHLTEGQQNLNTRLF